MSSNARVMKAGAASQALLGSEFNYEDLRLRCENYLDDVREQARKMLLDAQAEIEQAKKDAVHEGYLEGLEQGRQEAEQTIEKSIQQEAIAITKKRISKVIPALKNAVEPIIQTRDQAESHWQHLVFDLVKAITRKLIHRSIEAEPTLVLERVREVLKLVIGESQVQLHLASEDIEALGDQVELLLSQMNQTGIEVAGHSELTSGDCIVQMKYGEIDARIETQLDRIAAELLGDETIEGPEPV